ncbi:Cof-type HAD-IIB family hydrolase [Ectobacillus ponti]|uniref:Cof-type HAD-IIB family hydrolase n=1 Tax=Ectobacillus ponti TaxID=2961894 RepID=A0AA42BU37_9BACI|nr:Cof-type HAD-IIB family hydrolase [Ectobacillus ponti]MCP8970138.1 Cof-type HAD-IIB family hydrolase [Ectobacillus ponti]
MKLIALDLDGTVLNSKKEMSAETLRAIQKAQEQGHIVMALSGRSAKSIHALLDTYNLRCPVGSNNGTSVFVDGALIAQTSLTRAQAQQIALEVEEEFVPYNMATNKGMYAPRNWSERLELVLSSGRVPEEYYGNSHYQMFTTPPTVYGHTLFDRQEEIVHNDEFTIQKFLILGLDPAQKQRLQGKLSAIAETQLASSSPFNLEITHISGNKGSALQAMARHFGIPLAHTVAIGDERNDIPMLNVAGLSIAMENAEEEVKQCSDVVTLSNDEHGVAYAIEKYILQDSYV